MDSRTSYDFVALAKDVLERLAVDMRENLYYSLDAYSTASDFLASTLYRGQSMGWISDKSLLSAFEENMAYSSSGWSLGQSLLAVPRMARYVGEERWVITVYLLVAIDGEERAFVSVSVDADKLISYIVDSEALNQGTYLIVDGKGQPSGRACTASWRMPRGSNTPLLCSVASLIPRCLQRGI